MTDPATPASPAPSAPAAEHSTEKKGRAPVPYKYRGEGTGRYQLVMWNIGKVISRILSILIFRLHVRGQKNVPKTGGVLLLSNHQSFLDPWLLGIAPARQLHYMARDTLFKGGVLHYIAELYNAFPVRRGSADLGAIRNAVERLDKGYVLTIFPEGTRTEDGTIQNVVPGFTLILNRCKTEIPILPAVIDGAYEAWPRQQKMPKPRPIRIAYGKPIPSSEWRVLSPDQLAVRLREEFIQLQKSLHSKHSDASTVRMATEIAAAPPEAPRKRRAR